LLSQVGYDGLAIVRVFASLFLVETDYIATIFDPDFLDFERRWILGFTALRNALKPSSAAPEYG
jgi:hypothetical protein